MLRTDEYSVRFNRLTLLAALAVLVAVLGAVFAGGYWLGARTGADRPAGDPYAALAMPLAARTVTIPPPAGETGDATPSALPAAGPGTTVPEAAPTAAPARMAAPAASAPPAGRWSIQITTRSERAQAEQDARTLQGKGLTTQVETVPGPAGDRYRVCLGSYATRSDAEQYATALANRGLISDFLVMER
ncbi:MAG TPA: SPOR domain-containing protein [bacterium]|nr:SPOR domain-containing protein [bacterium]